MGMAPQLYTEVVTAAFANYMWSVWESLHTLSFTAALAIHTLGSTFPGSVHIPDPCYTTPLRCCRDRDFIFHSN